MHKFRFYVILFTLVLFSSCTTSVDLTLTSTEEFLLEVVIPTATNSVTPTPTSTTIPTQTPSPTLPPYDINNYQPPEGATFVNIRVKSGSSVTVDDLVEVMPWYRDKEYPNNEIIQAALENQHFSIEENRVVTGFGALYVLPFPEFIEYFREHFEFTREPPVIPLGRQVTPARFEKHQSAWNYDLPFAAYVIDHEIRLVVSNQATLDTGILALNIEPDSKLKIKIEENELDPNLILEGENFIGIPLRTIIGTGMDFGMKGDVLEKTMTVEGLVAELNFRVRISPAHYVISLGTRWETAEGFIPKLPSHIEKIANLGATSVDFGVVYFVTDDYSDDVWAGTWTADEESIRAFAEHVRLNNLKSFLSFRLECNDWQDSDCWPGGLLYANKEKLKESYMNDFIIPMAILSERNGIDSISISNEIDWVVSDTEYLIQLLSEVRKVYSGEVGVQLEPGNATEGELMGWNPFGSIYDKSKPKAVNAFDWWGLNLYFPGKNSEMCSDKEALTAFITSTMDEVAQQFISIGIDLNKIRISENGTNAYEGGCTIPWRYWPWYEDQPYNKEDQAMYIEVIFDSFQFSELGEVGGHTVFAYQITGCQELTCAGLPPLYDKNPYFDDIFKEYAPFVPIEKK